MTLTLIYSQAFKLSHKLHCGISSYRFTTVPSLPTFLRFSPLYLNTGANKQSSAIWCKFREQYLQQSAAVEEFLYTKFVATCFTIQTTSYRTSRRDFPFKFPFKPLIRHFPVQQCKVTLSVQEKSDIFQPSRVRVQSRRCAIHEQVKYCHNKNCVTTFSCQGLSAKL